MGSIDQAEKALMAQNEADRKAAEEAARKKAAEMAATAKKLYDGIGANPLTGHSVVVSEAGAVSVDPSGNLRKPSVDRRQEDDGR